MEFFKKVLSSEASASASRLAFLFTIFCGACLLAYETFLNGHLNPSNFGLLLGAGTGGYVTNKLTTPNK